MDCVASKKEAFGGSPDVPSVKVCHSLLQILDPCYINFGPSWLSRCLVSPGTSLALQVQGQRNESSQARELVALKLDDLSSDAG